ncbi:MAG: CoA transferase [Chloroflexi bacterium]|nr:CoA transferase [Chloroflexota bacterium]
MVITVSSDEQWHALCRAMGNPEWARREEFAGALSRHQHGL